jgi:inner membrane protein
MLLWHVGATTAFIRYAFRDPAMDLRYLALGAILPDLIDTPIGVVMWSEWQAARLAAHGIVFGAVVMVLVLVFTRRGPVRKQWMLLAVGVLLHLLLDAMWRQPETLWWPFLGWEFTPTGIATFGTYVRDVLTDPIMWLGEVAGLVYLAVLWRASGLNDPDARSRLLRSGIVTAPIGKG